MNIDLEVYASKVNEEDKNIIKRMISFIEKDEKVKIKHKVIDPMVVEVESVAENSFVFGETTKRLLPIEDIKTFLFPDIKTLHTHHDSRVMANNILQIAKEEFEVIDIPQIEQEETKEVYVEKEGVKFGDLQQITITEKEAEHLKKIKDILNGGKIIIRKGDIEIEVSDD